jgi:hypothetical protein
MRPKRQSNDQRPNKEQRRHSPFTLTIDQHHAIGAISRTLPKERRNAFLLHVLANLKVAPHTVTDQAVQAAIAVALREHAA